MKQSSLVSTARTGRATQAYRTRYMTAVKLKGVQPQARDEHLHKNYVYLTARERDCEPASRDENTLFR